MGQQSRIPKPKVSSQFIGGLYHPELIPPDIDVADFVQEVPDTAAIQDSLSKKKGGVSPSDPAESVNGVPIPLTEEEAKEADRQLRSLLRRIGTTRDKIKNLKDSIDRGVAGKDKTQFSVKVNLKKKPRLRRAMEQTFGYKSNQITYSMYKELLEARKKLEREETKGYLDGWPEDGDEEEDRN